MHEAKQHGTKTNKETESVLKCLLELNYRRQIFKWTNVHYVLGCGNVFNIIRRKKMIHK